MTDFFMKVRDQTREKLVTACDKEILDVELYSNGVKIKASSQFYGNELVTEREFLEAVNCCTSANVIGIKIIDLLVKNRLIHEDAVLWMENPQNKKQKVGHAILIT
ncbi:MAG: DUF424 family protein [Candidatus Heimdallarchaeaceae archaeon]